MFLTWIKQLLGIEVNTITGNNQMAGRDIINIPKKRKILEKEIESL